jgi:hypothetical protein
MQSKTLVRIDDEDGPRGRAYLGDLIGGLMGLGHSDEELAETGRGIEHRLTGGDWWDAAQLVKALDWLRECKVEAEQFADVDFWLDSGVILSTARNWAAMRASHVRRLQEAIEFIEPFYEHASFGDTLLKRETSDA